MCGISGAAGNLFSKDLDVFKTLLFLGQLRGTHSTGILSLNKGKKASYFRSLKNTCNAQELLDYKKSDSIISTMSKVILGHNRSATIGDVIKENAHPFEFDSVFAGLHNGTVFNSSSLDKYNEYDTDSEVCLYNIYKHGPSVIKKFTGAYAFVWIDTESATINFIRNKERPLAFIFDEDMKRLFWASEKEMLDFAIARCGIKTSGPVSEFKENVLYSLKYPKEYDKFNIKDDLTLTDFTPAPIIYPVHKPLLPHYRPGNSEFYGYGPYRSEEHYHTPFEKAPIPDPTNTKIAPAVVYPEKTKPHNHYRGFKGTLLTKGVLIVRSTY
jgi:predicted glutamine amidotransferase